MSSSHRTLDVIARAIFNRAEARNPKSQGQNVLFTDDIKLENNPRMSHFGSAGHVSDDR